MRWLMDSGTYLKNGIAYIPINNKIESIEQYKYGCVTARFDNPGETGYGNVPTEKESNLYQYHMLRIYIDDNNLIYINTQRNKVHVSTKKDGKEYYTTGGIVSNVTGFHEYRIDWEPENVDFYLDGNLLTTVKENVIDDFATVQLITSPDKFSEPMELDYVKVENLGK
jgi:beta-glucanase (GH16 family)